MLPSLLKNEDEYEENYKDGSLNGTAGKYIVKYAGALGNSLKVSVLHHPTHIVVLMQSTMQTQMLAILQLQLTMEQNS